MKKVLNIRFGLTHKMQRKGQRQGKGRSQILAFNRNIRFQISSNMYNQHNTPKFEKKITLKKHGIKMYREHQKTLVHFLYYYAISINANGLKRLDECFFGAPCNIEAENFLNFQEYFNPTATGLFKEKRDSGRGVHNS